MEKHKPLNINRGSAYMEGSLPLVSVVITTKNEAANISNCLESVKKQDYPQEKIEIIVVDNNSSDATKEIAGKYTDKVYDYGPNRAAQLNFGARLATGRYIIFSDADMIFSKNVMKECAEKCEQDDYVALYIPEKIIGNGFWIKVRDFERNFYTGTCIDAVRFVRINKFLEIGGFDEKIGFGIDDWDFDRRAKKLGKTYIIKSPLYHNERKVIPAKYTMKKKIYFHSIDLYLKKWGKNDPITKKQFGFWYRFFGVFVEKRKWKRLLMHPLLTLGIYFLRIMVGFEYLKSRHGAENKNRNEI